jgi:hypothetical protein
LQPFPVRHSQFIATGQLNLLLLLLLLPAASAASGLASSKCSYAALNVVTQEDCCNQSSVQMFQQAGPADRAVAPVTNLFVPTATSGHSGLLCAKVGAAAGTDAVAAANALPDATGTAAAAAAAAANAVQRVPTQLMYSPAGIAGQQQLKRLIKQEEAEQQQPKRQCVVTAAAAAAAGALTQQGGQQLCSRVSHPVVKPDPEQQLDAYCRSDGTNQQRQQQQQVAPALAPGQQQGSGNGTGLTPLPPPAAAAAQPAANSKLQDMPGNLQPYSVFSLNQLWHVAALLACQVPSLKPVLRWH